MNALTRWERYAPVGIGLEDMFKRLDAFTDSTATVSYTHLTLPTKRIV